MSLTLPGTGAMALPSDTTVVSPALFDDSTKVASTAFVKDNGGALAGVFSFSANTTLTTTHANSLVIVEGTSGPITITLPNADTYPPGTVLKFFNISGYSVVVTRAGTNTINVGVTSLSIGVNDTLTLVRGLSSGVWMSTDGSTSLSLSEGVLGSSLLSSGHQRLPNGLTLQWGGWTGTAVANSTNPVTFPFAFPTTCLKIFSQNVSSGAGQEIFIPTATKTQSGFQFGVTSTAGGWASTVTAIDYWALGY